MPYISDTGPTGLLPTGLLPLRRKSYSGFLRSEKNPSTPAGIEPANLGSRGEYDNHWTTGIDVYESKLNGGIARNLWTSFVKQKS